MKRITKILISVFILSSLVLPAGLEFGGVKEVVEAQTNVLGDRVWHDEDRDGIQDPGEPDLPGVIVRLYKLVDFDPYYQVVGSTYTDANGNYSFQTPEPGNYFIQFELPGGYTYSPKNATGSTEATDSDVKMANGWTDYFEVTTSTATLNIDAGMWQSMGGGNCQTVSFQQGDKNSYNGTVDTYIVKDDDEQKGNQSLVEWDFYPKLTYGLLRFEDIFGTDGDQIPTGKVIDSATLKYRVSGSDPGDDADLYEVSVSWNEDVLHSNFGSDTGVQEDEYGALLGNAPGDYGFQYVDVTGSLQRWYNGTTTNNGWIFIPKANDGVSFYSSEYTDYLDRRPKLEVTYCDPTTLGYDIGDEVWKDEDADGIQDNIGTEEFPGGGVTVKLWSVVSNSVVQTTKSTYDNSYGFSDVPSGDYYIEFVLPDGYAYTTKYASNASSPTGAGDDSDADETSGFTDQFNYDGSNTITDIDAGFTGEYSCYTIADGLAYSSDDNNSLIKVDLLTGKGTLINTSETADGIEAGALDPETGRIYTFDTATWGYLDVADAAWTQVGLDLDGETCVDQNSSVRTVSGTQGFDGVAYNPVDKTWWAAMRLTGGTLDVLVQIDKDDGTMANNCYSMDAPAGNINLTDIDDMAFRSDGTLYLLANNAESEGRVTVPMKDGNGDYTGAVTDLGTIWRADLDQEVTDIEGFSIDENGRVWITTGGWEVENNIDHNTLYEVLNLTGKKLIAEPLIQMSTANTLINGVAGINYSDFEAVICYGTSSGQGDTYSSIGDTVWLDESSNGYFDTIESGIANVLVQLYGAGPDGLFGTDDDVLLKDMGTGDNPDTLEVEEKGWYLFDNLPAGTYLVKVAESNFETGGPLASRYATIVDTNHTDEDRYNQASNYQVSLPWDTDIKSGDFGFKEDPTAVELLSFTAEFFDGVVELNWETLTESNTSSYILYRAVNGGEKEEIAEIEVDNNPAGGIYTYRDSDVTLGIDCDYYLKDIDLLRQPKHLYGPERVFIGWRLFLPHMSSGW